MACCSFGCIFIYNVGLLTKSSFSELHIVSKEMYTYTYMYGVTTHPLPGYSTMQTFKSYQRMYCTRCHRQPTTWYPHHANLQILSDDVLYMVSPQAHYLVSPPCTPSNLIRWSTVHGVTVNPLLGISTMQTFKSYQMMYCTWCHHKPTT